MKLSKTTVEYLKNFSTVNQNLWVEAGNKLSSISVPGNIAVNVTVPEEFPVSFGVYNLNEFLGAVSLFSDPEIEFTEKSLTIKQGKTKLNYFFAEKEVLTYQKSQLKMPPVDVEFVLTKEQIASLQKSAAVLNSPDISFIGDGSTIRAQVGDNTVDTSNTLAVEVGETDRTFNAFFKVENLKMVSADYKVELSKKGIARFVNQTPDTDYTMFVAIEKNSSFE